MSGLILSRRGFLGLMAAAVAAGALVPALKIPRKPYVTVADGTASFLGPRPGGFIGSRLIVKVHDWDGRGYPVDLHNGAYGKYAATERFYDFDLANFNRELPPFWHDSSRLAKYPNVHTWLRTERFGESVMEAERHLNFVTKRLL